MLFLCKKYKTRNTLRLETGIVFHCNDKYISKISSSIKDVLLVKQFVIVCLYL